MKLIIKNLKYSLLLIAVLIYYQCTEKDGATMPDDPQVVLSAPTSAGHGQYKVGVESGYEVNIPVTVTSPGNLKSLKVIKTVNLDIDPSFGDNGVLTVFSSQSGTNYEYNFNYQPSTEDVDQLVGFTFEAENEKGSVSQSDLTLVVTLSPRDNLSRRRWNLKSIIWETDPDNPNSEAINDCEKDNSMLLNEDGSMSVDYGSDTGAGDCLFDGFTEYTGWELTADDRYFIRTSYSIFSPAVTVVDTFVVKTLTVEKFAIQQTVDLSAFDGSTDEKLLYIYNAGPK